MPKLDYHSFETPCTSIIYSYLHALKNFSFPVVHGNLHSIRRGQTRAFYCDPPLVGRYITINILATNQALALCEIAVYDSELTSKLYKKCRLFVNNVCSSPYSLCVNPIVTCVSTLCES